MVAFCARGRVCMCVFLLRQTVWCLLQDTHLAAALCPLVLPWAAHRMLACFDALFSSTYCRHTHLYKIANISLKSVTLSQPTLLSSWLTSSAQSNAHIYPIKLQRTTKCFWSVAVFKRLLRSKQVMKFTPLWNILEELALKIWIPINIWKHWRPDIQVSTKEVASEHKHSSLNRCKSLS